MAGSRICRRMSRSSLVPPLAVAVVALLAVPIFLGGMFTTWRASQALGGRPAPPQPPGFAPPAPAPASVRAPEVEIEPELRPVDEAAMTVVEEPFAGEVRADATPGAPFRIEVAKAAGSSRVLRIDLDRDGRFDERWTMGAPMHREVSPRDDGVFTERSVWTAAGWEPAP